MANIRRHLASSPFKQEIAPEVEVYAVGDDVCHDLYGLGRVVAVEGHAVSVDFRSRTVRIVSPYAKLEKLAGYDGEAEGDSERESSSESEA
jgi:hypothetical protein